MLKILHFADAHIDIASQGRRDPVTGLPLRVLDFLKALDTIVDTAISEKVNLVLFAGDAYKDRTPVPTFQREWGKRIVRLSQAGIPTLLLVGNHDLSPAVGRAHALQEFDTLQVPHVHTISRPCLLKPDDLEGLPLQIIALPWINRSGFMANQDVKSAAATDVNMDMAEILSALINNLIEEADPSLPLILTAHASVEGAMYGAERSVMLGGDLTLSGGLVRNPRFSYVALGHIHKKQNLNPGGQPPVVYPGSIERVDFGEAQDDKFFAVASIEPGKDTEVDFRKLIGRRFIDKRAELTSHTDMNAQALAALPTAAEIRDAVFRLTLQYPREWESELDETALRQAAQDAFEFHLVRRPQMEARLRLPEDHKLASMTPGELLDIYWTAAKTPPDEANELQKLAADVIAAAEGNGNV